MIFHVYPVDVGNKRCECGGSEWIYLEATPDPLWTGFRYIWLGRRGEAISPAVQMSQFVLSMVELCNRLFRLFKIR